MWLCTFRKTIHYQFQWEKDLDEYVVAVAPYGGPIGKKLVVMHHIVVYACMKVKFANGYGFSTLSVLVCISLVQSLLTTNENFFKFNNGGYRDGMHRDGVCIFVHNTIAPITEALYCHQCSV